MKFVLSLMTAVAVVCGLRAQDKLAPKPEPAKAAPAKPYQDVNAETFDKLRKSEKDAVVLDVRTKEEYDKGHIAGSVLLDISSPDFAKEIAKLDKNKTYLVHCQAGGRSSRACKRMAEGKFSKLYNLAGGMNAWEKAGKPIEK
jgi:rhodanese-related sulfurtransferase